ncbi:MAG: hypothetical protein AAF568_12795 [Pseudomonadota bacterium]
MDPPPNLFVYVVADWETGGFHVDIADDVVYAAQHLVGPLVWVTYVTAKRVRRSLIRIERFASLERARRRGRELQQWPAGWHSKGIAPDDPWGGDLLRQMPDQVRARTAPVPVTMLVQIDDTPGDPGEKLPRRENWFDGNRPA